MSLGENREKDLDYKLLDSKKLSEKCFLKNRENCQKKKAS